MNKRILVVDDDKLVTQIVAAILNRAGIYEVETTNCPSEAFEWVFIRDYDLLISDVRMPLLDGDQLYVSLLNLSECLAKQPKVLLMSGALDESELARRAGDVCYIQKPFTPEMLLEKVAVVLASEQSEEDEAPESRAMSFA